MRVTVKKLLFGFSLLTIFLSICLYYQIIPIPKREISYTKKNFTETEYFIPVTNITSELSNLTMEELRQFLSSNTDYQIILPKEYPEKILTPIKSSTNTYTTMPEGTIIPKIISDPTIISILPIHMVDFRVKTIRIDGFSPWDSNDISLDPLFFDSQVTEDSVLGTDFDSTLVVNIKAVGEIILARGVAERIEKYNDVLYPFHKVSEVIKKADLTLATMEAPIYSQCVYCDACMVFCGKPEYAQGLIESGIDVVSLAANHIMDFGSEALFETKTYLDQNKISHIGAGDNLEEAKVPVIKVIKGKRYGFLAFNDVVPTNYAATENSAGSAWADIKAIQSDIASLRPQVDVLIIMMHWGVEYTSHPSQRQIDIARSAIDVGADLIIGDHPHWVQGFEWYEGKAIFYGIGNFIFDQMWSNETRQGSIVDLYFYNGKLVSFKLTPTMIDDYAQPRIADTAESKEILHRIFEASSFTQ